MKQHRCWASSECLLNSTCRLLDSCFFSLPSPASCAGDEIWERRRYFNTLNIYICFVPNIVLVTSYKNNITSEERRARGATWGCVRIYIFSIHSRNSFIESFVRPEVCTQNNFFFVFLFINRNNKMRTWAKYWKAYSDACVLGAVELSSV